MDWKNFCRRVCSNQGSCGATGVYADFQSQGQLMLPYYQHPIGGLGAHAGTFRNMLSTETLRPGFTQMQPEYCKEALLQVELR